VFRQLADGALFAVQVQSFVRITRVAVHNISEPEIYHGAGFQLRADERVRVQELLQICFECRSKSKKCDNSASRSFSEGLTTYPYCPC